MAGPSYSSKGREGPITEMEIKDEAYLGLSMPAPEMPSGARRSSRIRSRGAVRLESQVLDSVENLAEANRVIGKIAEFQRLEVEGGVMPPVERFDWKKVAKREEMQDRKRVIKAERVEARKRRRLGGEVGEAEATHTMKRASAGLLAHAGFEGANEGALDLFTRIATEHMRNVGRTFGLFIDAFSQKMSPEVRMNVGCADDRKSFSTRCTRMGKQRVKISRRTSRMRLSVKG